jgi:hypothetical protein
MYFRETSIICTSCTVFVHVLYIDDEDSKVPAESTHIGAGTGFLEIVVHIILLFLCAHFVISGLKLSSCALNQHD